uniref:Charged multivesicular body protein 2a n=1 Tax=Chlamydomonas leiostraca TaxID=1034604 RepID=A0A7S0S4Y1_9CHLO|mmetsp:Transcript_8352/g.20786  ORF Transcript_8352/g.20786 Transcript_8352/m.20786 type:complete len:238 (+) Transcript_8352:82-795(+)|eukprot:CAMPEP_0202867376 /NCGR_PEP_ID=MMETSP1391-20130828/9306_1 /ASSEMBLY_ACC=CAM_ASM_000867 /TAXON_ID=1034604 /ORGANISM="Chlamydomonas leiostraca, Strain SAG 11-49" /LENGTH=237 /DNA_ID=CAMNT_0049547419 /DNA_START=75 /DNA_END=788 /DNA_ORIENTATION=+
MVLEFIFGKKKTAADVLRENKRNLDKAIRELDRERMGLQNQEKRIIADIKKMAKEGQMDAVKVMAKSLVRNRHAVTKMYGLKSQLQAVSLRMATLKSTQAMADAMKGATKAMRMMNKNLNMPQLTAIMREFERQNERMEMTSDMMGDMMDDAFEGEGEEEETDDLVNQVLDEIGLNMASIASAPAHKVAEQQQAAPVAVGMAEGGGGGGAAAASAPSEGGPGIDDDLQARLDNLRRG